jgi:hypothetical protein
MTAGISTHVHATFERENAIEVTPPAAEDTKGSVQTGKAGFCA